MFWTYKYKDYSLWDQCGEPLYQEIMLMCDCIRNSRPISSFSDVEKRIWNKINGRYAHASDEGEMIPDVLVITNDNLNRIHQLFQEHKNYDRLIQNVIESYKTVEEIFKKYSHKTLHDNLGYYIRMEFYAMRMMAIHDLVDDGVLKLPADTSKSTLGMAIMLK